MNKPKITFEGRSENGLYRLRWRLPSEKVRWADALIADKPFAMTLNAVNNWILEEDWAFPYEWRIIPDERKEAL